uniref:cytidine deaminase n=1 Tax=Anaerococcus mediterraneensis TaxID=1870984 RepID=UPI0009300FB4|nr:cytidine deaminase [Anaerococcus mediterraneensis]
MTDIEKLIDLAIKNKDNSYSPYSNFRVSAVLMTKSGKIYKGVNIENASYSPTICAERSAIAAAVSYGEKTIKYIVITGDSPYTYPCGLCRQVIREFADEKTQIIIAKSADDYKIHTIEELLPFSFSKEDLG